MKKRTIFFYQSQELNSLFEEAGNNAKVMCIPIDYAKKEHVVMFCNGHGNILRKPFSIKNSPKGIEYLTQQVISSRSIKKARADTDLREIENNPSKKAILKAVRKCLGFLETNLRHPSLNTREFRSLKGPKGEKILDAYAQQKTSSAYRVFWYYGPDRGMITIVAIAPHH